MLPSDNDSVQSSARCTLTKRNESNMHRMLIKILNLFQAIINNNEYFLYWNSFFIEILCILSRGYTIMYVFWIYIYITVRKRRIRGDVAECLLLNCIIFCSFLLLKISFSFLLQRSCLSSRYCFGKIRVFSRIKKRRRKIGVYNLNFENIGGNGAFYAEYYAEAEISFQRRFLFFLGGGLDWKKRKKKKEKRSLLINQSTSRGE